MGPEGEIQKTILAYLEYKRLFFWRQNSGSMPITDNLHRRRFISFGTPGAPDIFVIKGGFIYGIEIKSSIGKQNENQIEFQKRFEDEGGRYYLVRSLDDVLKIGL